MQARITTLANGFRIVSEHMPGLKSAALAVYVQAGARHENADQNGIAHFLEHLAFKGTKTRSAYRIAETIEEVGGFLNAYTARETTAYFVRVLERDIPLAIELISDIILNSVFDPKEIEVERNVILHEIGEIEDSPEEVVFEALQRTAYPDQPFGRSIIGTPELVSGFGRDDIVRFVREHYRPERMILAIAGAVDHDRAVEWATEHFGGWKLDLDATRNRGVSRAESHRREKKIEQAQFAFAFEGPPVLHRMDCAARIYSVVMGAGASSRLFQEAREKRGLCYSISVQAMPHSDTGMLAVHAGTGSEEIGPLANLCMDEIKRSAEDLTEKEIERARTQIRVGILMAYESPMSRIERLGGMLALLGRIDDIESTIKRFDSVDVDLVREYAAGIDSNRNAALALYGPVSSAPELTALTGRLSH